MDVTQPVVTEEGVNTAASVTFELKSVLSIHKGPISCLAFSPNGLLLAVASADKRISLYDTQNYSCVLVFEGHDKGINAIAWSPDSQYIVSCSDDKTARIWSCEKGTFVRILDSFSQFPTCIAYNPRGTIIACSCVDHHIYFYSVFTRNMVKSIYAHSNLITNIEFSIDGSRLLTSSIDGFCRIWDCESGNCVNTYGSSSDNSPIVSAAFSPNNKYVVLSIIGKGINIWCLEHDCIEKTFNENHKIESHLCNASFYYFKRPMIITGSEDGCIVVYDIESNKGYSECCSNDAILCSASNNVTGDIVAGSMGLNGRVYVYKCTSS